MLIFNGDLVGPISSHGNITTGKVQVHETLCVINMNQLLATLGRVLLTYISELVTNH